MASLPHAVLKPANKLSIFCVEFYSVNHCWFRYRHSTRNAGCCQINRPTDGCATGACLFLRPRQITQLADEGEYFRAQLFGYAFALKLMQIMKLETALVVINFASSIVAYFFVFKCTSFRHLQPIKHFPLFAFYSKSVACFGLTGFA